MFISVISLMIISVILLLLTVNENKLADKIKAEEDLFDIELIKILKILGVIRRRCLLRLKEA